VKSTIGIELVVTMPKDKVQVLRNPSKTWDKHLFCAKCWTITTIVHPNV
jgi:hypothetical protein